ncbi:hypothetical protein [Bosea sp. (in: a-proteobacteria)]
MKRLAGIARQLVLWLGVAIGPMLPAAAPGLAAGGGSTPGAGRASAFVQPVLPADFCAVVPGAGAMQGELWRRTVPPPERGATLRFLAVDCASLHRLEAGHLARPAAMLTILDLQPDPRLPPAPPAALEALEKRFGAPELAAKAPVLGRDERAVYLQQGDWSAQAAPGPRGVSAFAFRGAGPFVVNIFHFAKPPAVAAVREQVEGVVRSVIEGSR